MTVIDLSDSPSSPPKPIQALFHGLAAQAGDTGLEYKAMLAGLDRRGFAFFILFAALLLLMPIDMLLPQIAGLTLLVCGLGLMGSAPAPWLPGFLGRMKAKKDMLEGLAGFFGGGWSTLLLTPRHPEFSTGGGEKLAAFALILLGIESIAPLPNTMPALAAFALAFGLFQRDGLVMLIGVAVTTGWTAFLITMAVGAHLAAPFASGWTGENAAWALKFLVPQAAPEALPHSP